ncbi:hypothetical protein [Psychroserpens sp. XS_ASV72]|uniref:hypothetical protein n=1 Tax=Psychroserpens sp. XS_ASV72 TaxID=3241293 RepID=UPI003513110E
MDLINNDFMPLINSLDSKSVKERRVGIKTIKSQMRNILKHFIECTWGGGSLQYIF